MFSGSFRSDVDNENSATIYLHGADVLLSNETERRVSVFANKDVCVCTQGMFALVAGESVILRMMNFPPNTIVTGSTLNYVQLA